VLRVECTKCARKGRYQVHKLIAKYGRNGNMRNGRSSSTATVRAAMRIAYKSAAI
jgi:hypothetical protein